MVKKARIALAAALAAATVLAALAGAVYLLVPEYVFLTMLGAVPAALADALHLPPLVDYDTGRPCLRGDGDGAPYLPHPGGGGGVHTTVSSGLYAVLTPREIMERTDVVVRGVVVDACVEIVPEDPGRGIIWVRMVYEIEPKWFVKGDSDKNLVVKVKGGKTDGYETGWDGMILKVGDEVITHLWYHEDAMYYLPSGWYHNTYLISDEGVAANARHERIPIGQLEDRYRRILADVARSQP